MMIALGASEAGDILFHAQASKSPLRRSFFFKKDGAGGSLAAADPFCLDGVVGLSLQRRRQSHLGEIGL